MSALFDALADDYDRTFTTSVVGIAQRSAVHQRLLARFAAGDRLLELGCGTGEDAVALARMGIEVLATDPSEAMLEAARQKAKSFAVEDRVGFRRLAAEQLARLETEPAVGSFDGVLSNFGALNLAPSLESVADSLTGLIRPGGHAVLCFLGRLVPWEWLWFGLRLHPRTAFRRLRRDGVRWRGARVRYPPLRHIRKAFGEPWRTLRVAGIGVLVPPSYAEPWAARHPRLIERLARLERAVDTLPPFDRLGDHLLIELERR